VSFLFQSAFDVWGVANVLILKLLGPGRGRSASTAQDTVGVAYHPRLMLLLKSDLLTEVCLGIEVDHFKLICEFLAAAEVGKRIHTTRRGQLIIWQGL